MNNFSIMDLFIFFSIGLAVGALIMMSITKNNYVEDKDEIIRWHNGKLYLEDAE
jgi:ABC-type antimicrobial peptide transport system permease subunit